ncbi:MAG: GNAT family N-acetyltransferase [Bacteroidales bacterium]|nr:GNAT family N-acetyltransferase [Bacteroidales bacterium]
MQFLPVTQNDLAELRNLTPEGWDDIVPDFVFYLNAPYCKPFKIQDGTKIAGVGTSITFGKTSWIAHIIVDKEYRRRGIGYRIVAELLVDLKADEVDSCSLIATEMGNSIYERFGFVEVTEYTFLQRQKRWHDIPLSPHVIPCRPEHVPAILELDKKVSGEDRELLLQNFLPGTLVYFHDKAVQGYYIPNLREGPVIADNEEAGFALMNAKYAMADKAVLPSDNTAGIRFLKENGFAETDKKGTRMVYGDPVAVQLDKMYARIGGNLG